MSKLYFDCVVFIPDAARVMFSSALYKKDELVC